MATEELPARVEHRRRLLTLGRMTAAAAVTHEESNLVQPEKDLVKPEEAEPLVVLELASPCSGWTTPPTPSSRPPP